MVNEAACRDKRELACEYFVSGVATRGSKSGYAATLEAKDPTFGQVTNQNCREFMRGHN